MTTDELEQLHDLLCKALDDEEVSNFKVPHTRGKRVGTDLARALDAITEALERRPTKDADALDRLAYLLSAEEWPGASGMEDVAEVVAATGRDLHQPGAVWHRH